MPNWCSNRVTITSDDVELLRTVKLAAEKCVKEGFFNEFVPRPQSAEDNWYEWNVSNWGTKWDTGVDIVESGDDFIVLSFDTAWGPPQGFYENLVEMGYDVVAYYYEPGMAFAGIFDNGNVDHYSEWGDSETAAEMLPPELDEMFYISETMREFELEQLEEELDQFEFEDDEEESPPIPPTLTEEN